MDNGQEWIEDMKAAFTHSHSLGRPRLRAFGSVIMKGREPRGLCWILAQERQKRREPPRKKRTLQFAL